MAEPITIATWPFGKAAAAAAMKALAKGEPALDAALAGAQAVEDDTSIRNSVGFGSLPDRLGRLTLDACVMDGRTLACGAVACVEHIRHPAALARRVMEKTPHVLLVGDGAKWFALQQGFPLEQPYTAESVKEWLDKYPGKKEKAKRPTSADGASAINVDEFNHDTVTVLSLDAKGHLGGVCTTSGLATSCRAASATRPSSGRGYTWTTPPGPPARPAWARRSSALAAASSSSSRCAPGRVPKKPVNWPASARTPRPGAAAFTRRGWRFWRWTRRGTSAPPAPRRPTSSTPSAAARRSSCSRRRRSGLRPEDLRSPICDFKLAASSVPEIVNHKSPI
jgi:hypothetical protein